MRPAGLALLVLVALMPRSAHGEDSISFAAPEDAKKPRVENCATALKNRCVAYGFAGVTADVAGEEGAFTVVLTCKTGWTDSMRKVANVFALVPCKKLEIVVTRALTTTEDKQFKANKKGKVEDVLASAAPEGTWWGAVLTDPTDERGTPEEALKAVPKKLLVGGRSVPAPKPSKRRTRNDTDTNGAIAMTDADWKKLGGTLDDTLQSLSVCWVADGRFVLGEHDLSKIGLKYPPDLLAVTKDDVRWLEAFTKNPLPFELTPVPAENSAKK